MDKTEYQKLVKKTTPKEKRIRNGLYAFLGGGLVGIICQLIYDLLKLLGISNQDSTIWTIIILIFISSLLTALGFFDRYVKKAQCGFIIPTSGFAHSVTSSALDYKKDGMITGLGSNLFKLAGSVIIYGIISGFLLTVVKVVLNV